MWRPEALQFLVSLLMSLEIYGNLFQPSWPNSLLTLDL